MNDAFSGSNQLCFDSNDIQMASSIKTFKKICITLNHVTRIFWEALANSFIKPWSKLIARLFGDSRWQYWTFDMSLETRWTSMVAYYSIIPKKTLLLLCHLTEFNVFQPQFCSEKIFGSIQWNSMKNTWFGRLLCRKPFIFGIILCERRKVYLPDIASLSWTRNILRTKHGLKSVCNEKISLQSNENLWMYWGSKRVVWCLDVREHCRFHAEG